MAAWSSSALRSELPADAPNDSPVQGDLDNAEKETDADKRTALYQDANRMIMEFLPGVPYAHTKPALAFDAGVTGYTPSPVSLEPFSTVSLGEN